MKKLLKTNIIIIGLMVMFMSLNAFSFWNVFPSGGINKVQKETQSFNNYMNDVGEKIIKSLNDKNIKALNDLFCEKIKDTEYLNEEINIIFDYIEKNGGLVIGDGNWTSPVGHGSNDYEGKTVEYLSCKYDGTVMIGTTKYTLRFTAYQILKNHLEYQGLLTLSFTETVSNDIISKALSLKKDNATNNKYLGFKLYNRNYTTYQNEVLFDAQFYENELYLIPNNLEDDR